MPEIPMKAQMIPHCSLSFDNFPALWTFDEEYFKPSVILRDRTHVYLSNHYRLRGTRVSSL